MRSVKIVIMAAAVSIPQTNEKNIAYLRSNSDTRPTSHRPDDLRRVTGESLSKKPNPIAELKQLFNDYNINFSSHKPKSPEAIFNILSQISSSFHNLSKKQKSTLRSKLETSLVSLLTENLGFTPVIAKKEVTRVLNRIFKGPEAVKRYQNAIMKFEGAPEQFMNTFNEVYNKLAVLSKTTTPKNLSSLEKSSYNNTLAV